MTQTEKPLMTFVKINHSVKMITVIRYIGWYHSTTIQTEIFVHMEVNVVVYKHVNYYMSI